MDKLIGFLFGILAVTLFPSLENVCIAALVWVFIIQPICEEYAS